MNQSVTRKFCRGATCALVVLALGLAGCVDESSTDEARALKAQISGLEEQIDALESNLAALLFRERYVCTFTSSGLVFGSHTFNAGDSLTFYDLEIRTYPTGFPDPDPRSIALPDWLDCTPE